MIEDHLPKAIPTNLKTLLLESFAKGEISKIHYNFYENTSEHDFFQGNCLDKVIFVNLPNKQIGDHPVVVLSNPCDTSPTNDHKRSPKVTYCAIKRLKAFEKTLKKHSEMDDDEIKLYLGNIRSQLISDIMYMPAGGAFKEEMIAIFSQIASCDMHYFEKNPPKTTSILAQKAYYLLLTKLSIHFLRFGDLKQT